MWWVGARRSHFEPRKRAQRYWEVMAAVVSTTATDASSTFRSALHLARSGGLGIGRRLLLRGGEESSSEEEGEVTEDVPPVVSPSSRRQPNSTSAAAAAPPPMNSADTSSSRHQAPQKAGPSGRRNIVVGECKSLANDNDRQHQRRRRRNGETVRSFQGDVESPSRRHQQNADWCAEGHRQQPRLPSISSYRRKDHHDCPPGTLCERRRSRSWECSHSSSKFPPLPFDERTRSREQTKDRPREHARDGRGTGEGGFNTIHSQSWSLAASCDKNPIEHRFIPRQHQRLAPFSPHRQRATFSSPSHLPSQSSSSDPARTRRILTTPGKPQMTDFDRSALRPSWRDDSLSSRHHPTPPRPKFLPPFNRATSHANTRNNTTILTPSTPFTPRESPRNISLVWTPPPKQNPIDQEGYEIFDANDKENGSGPSSSQTKRALLKKWTPPLPTTFNGSEEERPPLGGSSLPIKTEPINKTHSNQNQENHSDINQDKQMTESNTTVVPSSDSTETKLRRHSIAPVTFSVHKKHQTTETSSDLPINQYSKHRATSTLKKPLTFPKEDKKHKTTNVTKITDTIQRRFTTKTMQESIVAKIGQENVNTLTTETVLPKVAMKHKAPPKHTHTKTILSSSIHLTKHVDKRSVLHESSSSKNSENPSKTTIRRKVPSTVHLPSLSKTETADGDKRENDLSRKEIRVSAKMIAPEAPSLKQLSNRNRNSKNTSKNLIKKGKEADALLKSETDSNSNRGNVVNGVFGAKDGETKTFSPAGSLLVSDKTLADPSSPKKKRKRFHRDPSFRSEDEENDMVSPKKKKTKVEKEVRNSKEKSSVGANKNRISHSKKKRKKKKSETKWDLLQLLQSFRSMPENSLRTYDNNRYYGYPALLGRRFRRQGFVENSSIKSTSQFPVLATTGCGAQQPQNDKYNGKKISPEPNEKLNDTTYDFTVKKKRKKLANKKQDKPITVDIQESKNEPSKLWIGDSVHPPLEVATATEVTMATEDEASRCHDNDSAPPILFKCKKNRQSKNEGHVDNHSGSMWRRPHTPSSSSAMTEAMNASSSTAAIVSESPHSIHLDDSVPSPKNLVVAETITASTSVHCDEMKLDMTGKSVHCAGIQPLLAEQVPRAQELRKFVNCKQDEQQRRNSYVKNVLIASLNSSSTSSSSSSDDDSSGSSSDEDSFAEIRLCAQRMFLPPAPEQEHCQYQRDLYESVPLDAYPTQDSANHERPPPKSLMEMKKKSRNNRKRNSSAVSAPNGLNGGSITIECDALNNALVRRIDPKYEKVKRDVVSEVTARRCEDATMKSRHDLNAGIRKDGIADQRTKNKMDRHSYRWEANPQKREPECGFSSDDDASSSSDSSESNAKDDDSDSDRAGSSSESSEDDSDDDSAENRGGNSDDETRSRNKSSDGKQRQQFKNHSTAQRHGDSLSRATTTKLHDTITLSTLHKKHRNFQRMTIESESSCGTSSSDEREEDAEKDEAGKVAGPEPSLSAAQIRAILANDKDDSRNFQGSSSHWVRRSARQPSRSILNTSCVRALVDKLQMNDSDMVVLKMKKYLSDPDTPPVVLTAALEAMERNKNCEALYIQNFNEGMRDDQVLHLIRVLQRPECRIWCLNIGETYKVKMKTWKAFVRGLRRTKITHMYASEHTITPELKEEIRDIIRTNRKKHDMHINPDNLDVIIQCTHCWWNPINAAKLRPQLQQQGYEHLLLDKVGQGAKDAPSASSTFDGVAEFW